MSPRPLVPSSPRPLVHGSCIEPETTNRADAPRSCGRSSCRLWGHTHVARLTPSFAGIGTPAVRPAAIHSSTSIAGVRRRPFRSTTFAALPTAAPRGVPGSGARVRVQGGAVRADRPLRDPAHAVAFTTAVAVGGTGSVHRRTGMRAAPTLPGGEGSRPGSLPATDYPQNPPPALPAIQTHCCSDHRHAWRCNADPDVDLEKSWSRDDHR